MAWMLAWMLASSVSRGPLVSVRGLRGFCEGFARVVDAYRVQMIDRDIRSRGFGVVGKLNLPCHNKPRLVMRKCLMLCGQGWSREVSR